METDFVETGKRPRVRTRQAGGKRGNKNDQDTIRTNTP